MPYLPLLHSDDETRWWIAEIVLTGQSVTVACVRSGIAGFSAVHGDMLEHLYVAPAAQHAGIGARLLEAAKAAHPKGLRLYVFQENTGARRFYERHGFRLVELGDGTGNEERVPDALYAWNATAA